MKKAVDLSWANGRTDEAYARRRNRQHHPAGALGGPVILDDSSMTKVDFMAGLTESTLAVLAKRVVRHAMPVLRPINYGRRAVAYAPLSIATVPITKLEAMCTSSMTGDVQRLIEAVNATMQTDFNVAVVLENGFPSRPFRLNSEGQRELSDELWLCMSAHRMRVILDRTLVHEFSVRPYEAFLCKGPAFGSRIQTYTMTSKVGLRVHFYRYALYGDFSNLRLH